MTFWLVDRRTCAKHFVVNQSRNQALPTKRDLQETGSVTEGCSHQKELPGSPGHESWPACSSALRLSAPHLRQIEIWLDNVDANWTTHGSVTTWCVLQTISHQHTTADMQYPEPCSQQGLWFLWCKLCMIVLRGHSWWGS